MSPSYTRTAENTSTQASLWQDVEMKIYTRGGDDGSTGLIGGTRVSKAHPRVDAYGTVDEFNATLGWARVLHLPDLVDRELAHAQACCFELGAALATPEATRAGDGALRQGDVDRLETSIDLMDKALEPLKTFVVPGGSEAASRLHIARTQCRRTERLLVALAAADEVDPMCLRWLNRLSDALFVQARYVNAKDGVADTPWTARPHQDEVK